MFDVDAPPTVSVGLDDVKSQQGLPDLAEGLGHDVVGPLLDCPLQLFL